MLSVLSLYFSKSVAYYGRSDWIKYFMVKCARGGLCMDAISHGQNVKMIDSSVM